MRIIGLTGGIATGKSTVAKILSTKYNLTVIDFDEIAHETIKYPSAAFHAIVKTFGEQVLEDKETFSEQTVREIDREKLGKIVFSDPQKRRLLNQITHWRITLRIGWQFFRHAFSGTEIIIFDAPLLFELGVDKVTSLNVVVWCHQDLELERLIQRTKQQGRGVNSDETTLREEAWKKIQAQIPLEKKISRANVLIENNSTVEELEDKVDAFYKQHLLSGEALDPSKASSSSTRRYLNLFALAFFIFLYYLGRSYNVL